MINLLSEEKTLMEKEILLTKIKASIEKKESIGRSL